MLVPGAVSAAVQVDIRSDGDLVAGEIVVLKSGDQAPALVVATDTGSVRVDLKPGEWVITANVAGYWSSSEILVIDRQYDQAATVNLWPSGTLVGRMKGPGDDELPAKLDLSFRASPADTSGPPSASVACPVRDGRWRCELPAGKLDVFFEADGFIRQYFWDLDVSAHRLTELNHIVQLRRGSAVRGWVITEDGAAVTGTVVELVPRIVGSESLPPGRLSKFSEAVTDRGFFQIDGISPGAYIATAIADGYAPARTSVRVLENQTTVVDGPPLTLRAPRVLDIYVDPPVPPIGGMWVAKLEQIDNHGGSLAEVFESDVFPGQASRIASVPGGRYYLSILTTEARGTPGTEAPAWHTEVIDVRTERSQVFVTISAIEVVGKAMFGGEPLVAELTFGGRFNATRHALKTDDAGRFQTWLSRSGLWEIDIQSEEPYIETTVQREIEDGEEIEIAIPDTRVSGQVVDEQGAPAAQAFVRIRSLSEPVLKSAITDENGMFEALGLPVGPVSMKAEQGRYLTSDIQQLVLEDGSDAPESVLVLRRIVLRAGRIVGPDGSGVPGARVIALVVEDAPAQMSPLYTTDEDGRFELELSADAQNLILTVAAPGFAYRMLRASAAQEQVIIQVSQTIGSLVVALPDSVDLRNWDSPIPVVLHNGAFAALSQLSRWAAFNGTTPDSSNVVVAPLMEPGDYSACWIAPGQIGAFVAGLAGPMKCESGNLTAFGELHLTLANPDS